MQLPHQTVLVRSSQNLLLVYFSSSSEDAQQILALHTEQSDVTMSSIQYSLPITSFNCKTQSNYGEDDLSW